MIRYSKNKDINVLVNKMILSGWLYHRGKKHGSLMTPVGKKLTIPSTPSDHRAFYNFRRQVSSIGKKGYSYE